MKVMKRNIGNGKKKTLKLKNKSEETISYKKKLMHTVEEHKHNKYIRLEIK